jgi:serine/threonine protein kinase
VSDTLDTRSMLRELGFDANASLPGSAFRLYAPDGPDLAECHVDGRYVPIHYLARGGWSEVYVAADVVAQDYVVLKIPRRDQLARVPESRRAAYFAELHREIEALSKLPSSPLFVMPLYAFDHPLDGIRVPVLVLPLYRHGPLSRYLGRNRGNVIQLQWLASAARALALGQEWGLNHCDVKPDNILIVNGSTAAVTDFGMARNLSRYVTGPGHVIGTPAYAAPEVLEYGLAGATAYSDVFSFGVTALEVLNGRLPERGDDRGIEVTDVERLFYPELIDVLRAALRANPTRRPSLATLADLLEGICETNATLDDPAPAPASPAISGVDVGAAVAISEHNPERADEMLTQIAADPKRSAAHRALALANRAYYQAQHFGRHAEGLALAQQGIAISESQDSGWFLSHINAAFCLANLGQSERAIEYLKAVESRLQDNINDHDHAMHAATWVRVLVDLGRLDEAAARIGATPEHRLRSDALVKLANAHLSAGRPGEALPLFEHALRLDPADITALNNRAAALRMLGRNEQALEVLQAARTIYPDDLDIGLNLFHVALELRMIGLALYTLACIVPQLSADDPLLAQARQLAESEAFRVAGENSEEIHFALLALQSAVGQDPVERHYDAGYEALAERRLEDAVDQFRAGLELARVGRRRAAEVELRVGLGEALLKQAIAAVGSERDPEAALLGHPLLSEAAELLEVAAKHGRSIAIHDERIARLQTTRGRVLAFLGRWADAREVLEDAVACSRRCGNGELLNFARFVLERVYAELGSPDD